MSPTDDAGDAPRDTGGADATARSTAAADAPAIGGEQLGDAVAYCPLITPFDADGAVDEDALATLVSRLVEAGIDGLVPCGTTGEFAALTDDEQRRVVETTVEAADGHVPVLAGVGGTAPGAVRDRIDAAADAGADAALVVAPYYGGQASPSGNEAFFRTVLQDSPLPAYLYDIPSAVGQSLEADTVRSLAEHDAVAGIKNSTGDLSSVDELVATTPPAFAVFQGWDAQLVPALAMGADAAIAALSHLFLDSIAAAAEAVAEGDLARARAVQFEVLDGPFREFAEHGFEPSIKAVLEERGIVSTAAVRPPVEGLSPEDRDKVLETVADAESAAERLGTGSGR